MNPKKLEETKAQLVEIGISLQEAQANARFIAAAPDMYESLSVLESFMSSKFKRQKGDGGIYFDDIEIKMMIRIAHQTLCKARGEL